MGTYPSPGHLETAKGFGSLFNEFIEPSHHIYVTEAASSQYIFTKQNMGFSRGLVSWDHQTFLSFENEEGRKGDTVIVFLWRAAVGRLRREQATVRHSQGLSCSSPGANYRVCLLKGRMWSGFRQVFLTWFSKTVSWLTMQREGLIFLTNHLFNNTRGTALFIFFLNFWRLSLSLIRPLNRSFTMDSKA